MERSALKMIQLNKKSHQLPVNQVHTFGGFHRYPSTTEKRFASISCVKNCLGQGHVWIPLLSFKRYKLAPNIQKYISLS